MWLCEERAAEAEAETQAKAQQGLREEEQRAKHTEQQLEGMLENHTWALDEQGALAQEQDRNIRRLEELLREQSDQARRERRDHSRGVDQLISTASLSESKTQLCEEQTAALRRQLYQQQAELRASERAWASDRAALLATVATVGNVATERPKRPGARRKASP